MSPKTYSRLVSPKLDNNEEHTPENKGLGISTSAKTSPKESTKGSPHHKHSHSYASFPSGVSSWHDGPAIPEVQRWRDAESLERPIIRNLKNAGLTTLFLLFPAAYLGLGVSVARLHGLPITNPSGLNTSDLHRNGTYNTLQQVITVAVTLFPIIFALIIGKTMKTSAQFKAERGTSLLQIEQMIASKTFGSTLFAPLIFKRINPLGVVLLSLWLISPLTTQALQRIFSAKSNLVYVTSRDLYYLNTDYANPSILEDSFSGVEDIAATSLSPLFLSQLMQPVTNSAVDVYGNPRIPLLKSVMSNASPDRQGNYNVHEAIDSFDLSNSEKKHIFWSSSVGIPIEGLPSNESDRNSNTIFTLHASYWAFHCSQWAELTGSDILSMAGPSLYNLFTNCGVDCLRQHEMNQSQLSSSVSMFFLINDERNNQGYRNIRFGSRNDGIEPYSSPEPRFTTTECEINLEQVQTSVICKGKDCAVKRIRSAPKKDLEPFHPGVARIALRVLSYLSPLQSMTTTSTIGSSYFERWLSRPGKILSDANANLVSWSFLPGEKQVDLSKVSVEDFEERLGYIFTTFYNLAVGLVMIPRQLPSHPAPAEVMAQNPGLYKRTSGVVSRRRILYHCDWAWLSVLVFSCVVVVSAIGLNAYMQYYAIGPDVLGYVSTITQNSPFIPLPRGGSTMSGIDRALKLADLKVRLQDIDPDGDVGHIALSSIDGEPLRDRRKYW